jgi:hypothetical protein
MPTVVDPEKPAKYVFEYLRNTPIYSLNLFTPELRHLFEKALSQAILSRNRAAIKEILRFTTHKQILVTINRKFLQVLIQ